MAAPSAQPARTSHQLLPAAWAAVGAASVALMWLLTTASHVSAAPSPHASIAGGAGLFMMPAQFGDDSWGLWLLDVDRQVLLGYSVEPDDRNTPQLQLVAARQTRFDRGLRDFNSAPPSPGDVQELIELEADNNRVRGNR